MFLGNLYVLSCWTFLGFSFNLMGLLWGIKHLGSLAPPHPTPLFSCCFTTCSLSETLGNNTDWRRRERVLREMCCRTDVCQGNIYYDPRVDRCNSVSIILPLCLTVAITHKTKYTMINKRLKD